MAKKKRAQSSELSLSDLSWEQENGWLGLTAADEKKLEAYCRQYRQFISTAKTEREANDAGVALAEAAGFVSLAQLIADGARPAPGTGIYHSIGGKTLILFKVGRRPITEGMHIVGGHTDSPRLDLKPRPLYEEGGMALLDTHYYGGIRSHQWVTMPLALHGVVLRADGTKVTVSIGEDADDPVLTITDLLPHLGKDQGQKKLAEAISGEGLNVLVASRAVKDGEKPSVKLAVLRLLHEKYGLIERDLASAELEIVPAGPARELGLDRSCILGYGQDDRVCAYAGMRALLDLKGTPECTAMCILCDKEEIGSVGTTGMQGRVFENVVAELANLLTDDYGDLALRRCLKRSKMLSADVNAVHDPNYPEVSAPNDNMAKLNHGVILTKYCGSRGKSGSNDASAEYMAWCRRVFEDAKVMWQPGELGKVDQGGGGTIAYMLAKYEMDVVDCGCGMLSMHAPYEVVSKFDAYMTCRAYAAFYAAG